MVDIFKSSKVRFLRAKIHIDDLQERIKSFLDKKPYASVIEPDSDGVHQLHIIKFTKGLPVGFAGVAADAVDNLRAALDLAWYAIAIASGAIKSGGEAKFPFADSATKFDSMIGRGFKNFSQDILTLLHSFKPYKGGNDLLWALNRICSANKHRMLAPIGVIPGGIVGRLRASGPARIPALVWDRSKNEIMYLITGPDTTIGYDIDLAFDIAFDEVEIVGGQPAIAVLNQLSSIVHIIIGAIEAEALRLGFI